jgi:hypothetical protein
LKEEQECLKHLFTLKSSSTYDGLRILRDSVYQNPIVKECCEEWKEVEELLNG